MELKEFIKKALSEIIEAVDEVSEQASREVYLHNNDGARSIEFDIAVSAAEKGTSDGGGGIRAQADLSADLTERTPRIVRQDAENLLVQPVHTENPSVTPHFSR